MSTLRQLVLILVLAGLGAGAWYLTAQSAGTRTTDGTEAAVDAAVLVEVAAARVDVVEQHVEAVGTLRARQAILVKPNAAGRVTSIRFEAGQWVEKGEILLTLDSEIEEASVAEASAMLEDAKAQYERARRLLANNTVAQARVDELRAAYAAAQARLAAADRRLRDRAIRAPFAGVVGLREVDLGARIDESTVVTTLDDLSAVELEFSVPEVFFGRVRRGQAVTATTAAFPDRTFAGAVTGIDARIDPVTRSFRVRAELPNSDMTLAAGLFMVVRATLGARFDAVLIPEQAVVTEGRSTYVFRVRDSTAERVDVRLGQRRVGEVEVVEGLQAGDRVVTAGLQRVRDGVPVRLRGSDAAPTS